MRVCLYVRLSFASLSCHETRLRIAFTHMHSLALAHTRVHTHAQTHARMHAHYSHSVHSRMFSTLRARTHTHTDTHTQTNARAHTHAHTRTRTHFTRAFVYAGTRKLNQARTLTSLHPLTHAQEIHDTWWLVNIVDHDFINGNIFDIFQAVLPAPASS